MKNPPKFEKFMNYFRVYRLDKEITSGETYSKKSKIETELNCKTCLKTSRYVCPCLKVFYCGHECQAIHWEKEHYKYH
jgi:hypothetical protein